jgi:glycosyltransferase involved in cell wall biosynthesis
VGRPASRRAPALPRAGASFEDRTELLDLHRAEPLRMGDWMKLSLVIPAHNEESYIGDCLTSVMTNGLECFHEVIVVDNASTDRTYEVASARPGVRVIAEAQKGAAYARQRGLDEATGDMVAFIDADTRLSPTWGKVVQEAFRNSSDLVCLSGPYQFYDGPKVRRWLQNMLCWAITPVFYRLCGYALISGNFVVKKEVMRQAGGFDRTIDLFGDDTDIARRISLRGKLVYSNDLYVLASGRRFYVEGLFKANLLYGLNIVWVVLFHRSHVDVRMVFPKDR